MDKPNNTFVMTAAAEIAFPPYLHERNLKFSKEGRYEIALLLAADHLDLKAMKALCVEVAETANPGITRSPTAWKYPWSSADAYLNRPVADGKVYDNSHMVGKTLLNSHKPTPPKLSILMPGRGIVDFWEEDARASTKDKFYAGLQVMCEFSFVYYPASNGLPCVTSYVNKVLSLNKGERRGGGKSGQETWGAHVGHLSQIDPTDPRFNGQIDY